MFWESLNDIDIHLFDWFTVQSSQKADCLTATQQIPFDVILTVHRR